MIRLEQISIDSDILAKYNGKLCLFSMSGHSSEFCRQILKCGNKKIDIEYIIEANSGKHGKKNLCGVEVEVCGYELLGRIDTDEYLFVITDDYYIEVYDVLCGMHFLEDVKSQVQKQTIYYYLDKEGRREKAYRNKFENTPLENVIVFRSGPHFGEYLEGLDFADNSRVLFEYMLHAGYNKKYRLVWIVKNPSKYADKYKDYVNVEFISGDLSEISDKNKALEHYYHTICLAKYFFFTDAYGIGKYCRKDQMRIQLWHGCGFKSRLSGASCGNRYEYMTVTGPLYADIHAKVFGLRLGQLLVTGLPKGDLVYSDDYCTTDTDAKNQRFSEIKKLLSIPDAQHNILWLPTYRMPKAQLNQSRGYEYDNEINLPIIDRVADLYAIDDFLDNIDTVLIVKLHPFQKECTGFKGYKRIVFLENSQLSSLDIHINSMMGMMDALISDYSSAAVDYLALNRPIAFTIDDIDRYKADRGFIFENIEDFLPGELLYSLDDLSGFINNVSAGIDKSSNKREKLRKTMNPFDDGRNCERIVKALGI